MTHEQKLKVALGDINTYYATGKTIDYGKGLGNCACGHIIKFGFYVKSDVLNREEIVGCDCIEYFPETVKIKVAEIIDPNIKIINDFNKIYKSIERLNYHWGYANLYKLLCKYNLLKQNKAKAKTAKKILEVFETLVSYKWELRNN